MRASAVLAIVLAALLVVAPALAQTAAEPGEARGVTIGVRVQSDGDARWNVSTTVPLNNESDVEAFERLASEYENGADVGFTASTFRDAAERAETRTGRSMEILDVERRARVVSEAENRTGVLVLSFTWTNFANATNETVTLGPAFRASGLNRLDENQRLLIYPPSDYRIDTVRPMTQITDSVVQWEGPVTFDRNEPAITYETRSIGGTETQQTWPPTSVPPGAVAAAVLVSVTVVYAWLRRDQLFPADSGSGSGAEPATAASGDGGVETQAPDEEAPVEEPADNGAIEAANEDIDPELLSDEERVERLLRSNDGRMKQADIVKETGWSNAKVSQLLSSMDEDGDIEKLRIGRENLISLDDDA